MTKFPLGAVLSVSTGIFVADNFGEVHALLDHLVGEPLFTHSLIRVAEPCAAEVLRQYPALAEVVVPDLDGAEAYAAWAAEQAKRFGAELEIAPMAAGAVAHVDPIEELTALVGADRVLVAVLPQEQP